MKSSFIDKLLSYMLVLFFQKIRNIAVFSTAKLEGRVE